MLNNISPLTKPKKNSETHTKGQKDSFGIHAYGNYLTSFLGVSIFDSTGSITMNSSIPTCIQKTFLYMPTKFDSPFQTGQLT